MASGDTKPREPPPGPYDLVNPFNDKVFQRDKDNFILIKPLKEKKEDFPTIVNGRSTVTPTSTVTSTVPKAINEKAEEDFKSLPDSNEKTSLKGVTKEYFQQHEEIKRREKALGFDHHCTTEAEPWEVDANSVVQELRKLDVIDVYDKEAKIEGYAGQKHKRVPGDRFLLNAAIIEKTRLYGAIQKMPKGAHLHIHFNANLLPEVLLDIAKKQEHMYIMSNIPLTSKGAFERCHLRFSILSKTNFEKTWPNPQNLFTSSSQGANEEEGANESGQPRHIMLYSEFREKFWNNYKNAYTGNEKDMLKVVPGQDLVNEFLTRKIVFQADEAYNPHQTAKG